MRFADEMRGSVGERCTVTDLRTGKLYHGAVVAWDDATKKADVAYDDGRLVRVGYTFVRLHGEEVVR